MASIERRLSDLEQRLAKPTSGEPCFWCECEQEEGAAPMPCTHGGWNPIPHETALAELN